MDSGKFFLFVGGLVLMCAFVAMLLPSTLPKLPGDIYIKKQGFVFYFPLVTSIILSILISIVFTLLSKK